MIVSERLAMKMVAEPALMPALPYDIIRIPMGRIVC